MLRWSHSKRIDALWVGCFDRKGSSLALSRVGSALHLIKQYDPLRYDRLCRDLERIWVILLPGPQGLYRHDLRLSELDERFVLADTTGPELIASTIVHEATHSRLTFCGIGYEEDIRVRVEAICFRRQIAFARRLPGGDAAREEAERNLTLRTPAFWTDAAMRHHRDTGAADALRYLGTPDTIIRVAFVLRRWVWRVKRLAERLTRVSDR